MSPSSDLWNHMPRLWPAYAVWCRPLAVDAAFSVVFGRRFLLRLRPCLAALACLAGFVIGSLLHVRVAQRPPALISRRSDEVDHLVLEDRRPQLAPAFRIVLVELEDLLFLAGMALRLHDGAVHLVLR